MMLNVFYCYLLMANIIWVTIFGTQISLLITMLTIVAKRYIRRHFVVMMKMRRTHDHIFRSVIVLLITRQLNGLMTMVVLRFLISWATLCGSHVGLQAISCISRHHVHVYLHSEVAILFIVCLNHWNTRIYRLRYFCRIF